jgi:hypothetical protein
MVACTLRYKNITGMGVSQDTIERMFERMSDEDFGVNLDHLELAKRIAAFNLRQGGRKNRITSKYWNVNGKCVNIELGAPVVATPVPEQETDGE